MITPDHEHNIIIVHRTRHTLNTSTGATRSTLVLDARHNNIIIIIKTITNRNAVLNIEHSNARCTSWYPITPADMFSFRDNILYSRVRLLLQ